MTLVCKAAKSRFLKKIQVTKKNPIKFIPLFFGGMYGSAVVRLHCRVIASRKMDGAVACIGFLYSISYGKADGSFPQKGMVGESAVSGVNVSFITAWLKTSMGASSPRRRRTL